MRCSAVTWRECTWQQAYVAQTGGCFSFPLKNDCSVISDINLGDLQRQSCWDSNFQIRQHLKLQNSARAACWSSGQQQLLEAIIMPVTHCGRNVGSVFFTTKLQFIEVCSCVEVWPLQHWFFSFSAVLLEVCCCAWILVELKFGWLSEYKVSKSRGCKTNPSSAFHLCDSLYGVFVM